MTETNLGNNTNHIHLECLLSIWPIVSSIAAYTPAGDLLSLARTSSTIRALTHGFPIDHNPGEHCNESPRDFLELRIGNHQTSRWANLKSLAPFSCSSPFHKEPKTSGGSNNVTKPCRFCSRPVCKACIVRSFFADPSQSKNTFRYRARYLCSKCWDSGNLRKDFRYPAESVSREHIWRGRSYGQRGGSCSCSASEDNWLCRGCRSLQNISGPSNSSLAEAEKDSKAMIVRNRRVGDHDKEPVHCYGFGCNNTIMEATRDRRRICLWCSKCLPRQFGGEDRLRWEEKQLEIRAAAAAARSADIEEWARNRFKGLTMSRRDMRGTEECILLTGRDGPQHDEPMFVRHLDAINYRKYMSEEAVPSPASVYQSKHGRWTYSRGFLECVNQDRFSSRLMPPTGIDKTALFDMTRENGLKAARSNLEMRWAPRRGARADIFRLAAHFYESGIMEERDMCGYEQLHRNKRGDLETLRDRMYEQLEKWEGMDEEARKSWTPMKFSDLLPKSNTQRGVRRNEDDNDDDETAGGEQSGVHPGNALPVESSEEQARMGEAAAVPTIPSYEAVLNAESGSASQLPDVIVDP